VLAAAAAAATLALGACNIVGPLAAAIHGPPKIDAEYALQDRSTLVFVDDRQNILNRRSLRRHVADEVSRIIMQQKLVTVTRPPRDAMALVGNEDRGDLMSMEEIGRSLEAEQVIYIEMTQFSLSPDGYTPSPQGACRVRVIDVANRARLYPSQESSEPSRTVQVAMPREPAPEMYRTAATRARIEEELASLMADRVAKLFYRHETGTELGGRMAPQ
jgi:hypothetical protein